jgi:beta-lactamase regulating signal transducer with metallopeptidase domain
MTHSAIIEILLEAAARALLGAIALWLGMRLLRVGNAMVQKAAWIMVLCAALAMPLLMRWQWRQAWVSVSLPQTAWLQWMPQASHADPLPPARAAKVTEKFHADQSRTLEATDPFPAPLEPAAEFDQPGAAPEVEVNSANTPSAPPHASQTKSFFAWLFEACWLLYFGVALALFLRLLVGLISSLRLWSQAAAVHAHPALRASSNVPVRWTRKIASPVNIGRGILLPADYTEWDVEKLRVVLAHETSHVRQRDFYLQLLAGLYAALIWFSPLGWWLKRKLADLAETISDRAGMAAASSPVAYAELLLEFAARPRPTFAGVAMAHSTNLHQRIERLLNESTFSRVFAGKRRLAIALLLPAVLIAGAALVRVQAAAVPAQTQPTQAAPSPAETAPTPAAQTGQSHPDQDQVTDTGSNAEQKTDAQEPPASTDPSPAPMPEGDQAPFAEPLPKMVIVPPIPSVAVAAPYDLSPLADGVYALHMPDGIFAYRGFDGDDYAVIGDKESSFYSGRWDAAEAENARKVAHGRFLLFRHDGKDYVVDDPAIVSQIDAMEKTMSDERDQMRAMEAQVRAATEHAREEARKAREIAANVPAPDLTKEMAALNEAVANLKNAQGGSVPREKLEDVQREVSAIQRQLVDAEVKASVHLNLDDSMIKFNADQGKFGEMGRLGAEIGKTARENHEKIRSIIDESLKNGKAKPVN